MAASPLASTAPVSVVRRCAALLVLTGAAFAATLEGGFSGLTPNEKCEGCRAVVDQLHTSLAIQPYTESNVMDLLEGLCMSDPQRFVSYKYPPPKMQTACAYFLDSHEEQVESFFFKLKSAKHFTSASSDKLCKGITGICTGVEEDESKLEKKQPDVYMDGKPQDVQGVSDGALKVEL